MLRARWRSRPSLESAATLLEGRAQTEPAVLRERDEAERDTRRDRDSGGEEDYGAVDPELVQPRETFGLQRQEQSKRHESESDAQEATQDSEGGALEEELPRQSSPAGSERRSERELLLAAVGPDEKKVGHVGTGDQEHEPHRAQEDPEHFTHVADDVLFEGMDVGTEVGLLHHRESQAFREFLRPDGDHARHVGVGLLETHAGLQSSDALIAEVSHLELGAVELLGEKQVGAVAEKSEISRENADDLPALCVDDEATSENGRIATEMPLPVGVTQNHGERISRRIVLAGEDAPEDRLDPEELQRAVGDAHRVDPLGLPEARHRRLAVVPYSDVFENLSLFAIGEVERRRLVDGVESETGGAMPHPDEALGLLEGERLQQDSVDDGEDGRVGADAQGQGQDGDEGKTR